VELESADLAMRPTTQVPVDEADVPKLIGLIDALDELDDVQAVHANFDVDADVLERATA
jgi:transcriptional/translational regulatory protein YebC/TACO1